MPSYISSPYKPTPNSITPGMPFYLFGSFNDRTGPTTGNVLANSASSTTATLTVQILSGNVPVVGALITVVGCANSANFNVVNAAISNVSAAANPDAGIYLIQYPITSTTQGTTADAGQFIIPQPEIGETLANVASAPCVMPFNTMGPNLNQAITVVASFPTLSGAAAATVVLQQAVQDYPSEYSTVATIASVVAGAVSGVPQILIDPTLGRFFRALVSGVSGTGTIVVKILL